MIGTLLVAGSDAITLFQQVDVMIRTQLGLVGVYRSMKSITSNIPPLLASCRMLPCGCLVNLYQLSFKRWAY